MFTRSVGLLVCTGAITGCSQDSDPSQPQDDPNESGTADREESIEATIQEVESQFDSVGETILMVNFDYTVRADTEIKPLLTVTDQTGSVVYEAEQVNADPAEVDLSIEHLRDGGTFTIELTYDSTVLASDTIEYSGFSLAVENTNIDGMRLTEYSNNLSSEAQLTIKNVGDLPAEVDDLSVTIGPTPLDAVFLIAPDPLPIGATKQLSASSLASFTAGEYEMQVEAIKNGTTIGTANMMITLTKTQ